MPTEVVPGVWLLDLGLVTPFASNAFLVDEAELEGFETDEPAVSLCDAGLQWNRPSLRSELADAGYGPADLDRVLVTHYDLDHVGGLASLLPEFDGPVYIGEPDHALATGASEPSLTHHKGIFHRVARRFFPLPDDLNLQPVEDGERVGHFTVHHTPGHNPGHVVYVHDAGIALLGDLVWEEDGALTTPFWLDSYDMRDVHRSVDRLADRAQPFEVAAMAHGSPIASGGGEALLTLAERLRSR